MDGTLFKSSVGDITANQIKEVLKNAGANDCDILYVHTGMTFGLPALKRKELLAGILDIFESLDAKTLVFPTFTFSFCNNEVYDPDETSTPMGALNEYARKSGKGVRSDDPLLSVYVIGENANLAENLSDYSIGAGSSYDKLHKCGKDVKFLFFGTDMRDCFTFTHYVEAMLEVPYRYNRQFKGIIHKKGKVFQTAAFLYSTYGNCRLTPEPVVHDAMEKRGMLRKAQIGDGNICCFSEKDGYQVLEELIYKNPYCLTDGSFDPAIRDFNYNPSGSRVVSVL